MWQLRRLGFMHAQSAREVDKLTYEDVVTGLSNLHRLRQFIDQALAAGKPECALAIALIDLGGFDEIEDAIGDSRRR